MLRSMRKNVIQVTMWLVIVAFIATIFFVWGMESAGRGSGREPTTAAVVNGERISWPEFQRALQQQVTILRQMYGDRWRDDLIQDLDLSHRILDDLITSRLLLQEAERLGLEVSREELAAAVMENPLFTVDGTFRPERYRQLLQANRVTPERYEEGVRQALLRQKVTTLIQASAKVSDIEAWEAFRAAKEKVRVVYVSLPRSSENTARLEQLRTAAGRPGAAWGTVLQNSGLHPKQPAPFESGAAVVDPPDRREFHLAVLRLRPGEWSQVVEGGKSAFLIHLLGRDSIGREAFEKEKASWTQRLLAEKRLRVWTAYVQDLKRRAKIEIAGEST
jgi:hypothetical protein